MAENEDAQSPAHFEQLLGEVQKLGKKLTVGQAVRLVRLVQIWVFAAILAPLAGAGYFVFKLGTWYGAPRSAAVAAASKAIPKARVSEVVIENVLTGADVYKTPYPFVSDHVTKLYAERAAAPGDHVEAIIESEAFGSYDRFTWRVTLIDAYQKDFAVTARAAYLIEGGKIPIAFQALDWKGEGTPFRWISVEVPGSDIGDRVLVVASIYAVTPGVKVRDDIKRMLATEVKQ